MGFEVEFLRLRFCAQPVTVCSSSANHQCERPTTSPPQVEDTSILTSSAAIPWCNPPLIRKQLFDASHIGLESAPASFSSPGVQKAVDLGNPLFSRSIFNSILQSCLESFRLPNSAWKHAWEKNAKVAEPLVLLVFYQKYSRGVILVDLHA